MPAKPRAAQWHPPRTAPKDGTLILGDFGWPWPCPAVWNEHDQEWVLATIQAQEMQGGTLDYWFESEHEPDTALRQWLPVTPLPVTIPRPKK